VAEEPGDPGGQGALTRRQLELVLRRAAELERSAAPDDLMTAQDAERIGVEAGLSRDAVRQALVELEAGELAATLPPSLVDRVIGARAGVFERAVPGPPQDVRMRVERFMRQQLMQVKRNFGDRMVWTRARGWGPLMLRLLDFSRGHFPAGVEVETRIAQAEADSRVRIRVAVALGERRRDRALAAGIGLLSGSVLAASSWAMLGGHLPAELALTGVGALIATGSLAASRRAYGRDVAAVADTLERFLDSLEHER
jgi:hypothetical protein